MTFTKLSDCLSPSRPPSELILTVVHAAFLTSSLNYPSSPKCGRQIWKPPPEEGVQNKSSGQTGAVTLICPISPAAWQTWKGVERSIGGGC